ncbi:TlpA family protein disulfide reductase [bacterium 1XD21-13]|nr:TlpA family protein disulfide reductase [bacterium 1XD21-13]
MKKRYLLPGLFLTMLLCGCAGKNEAEQPETKVEAEEAQETPSSEKKEDAASEAVVFEGQDLDGNTITQETCALAKLTMINVWATYCNPCLKEMPELGELAKEYEAADFQLIGVVSDVVEGQDQEATEYAASLVEETGADYPHMLLNESLYNGLLAGVSAVPTTFFLNEKGEVLDVVVGAMDKSHWKEKVDGLLEDL